MLSDVDRTHSFNSALCGAIARLKQKYRILNRHAKKQIRHNIQLNKQCPQEEHSSDFATIAIEHMVAKFQ